jgi:hypothetical protein
MRDRASTAVAMWATSKPTPRSTPTMSDASSGSSSTSSSRRVQASAVAGDAVAGDAAGVAAAGPVACVVIVGTLAVHLSATAARGRHRRSASGIISAIGSRPWWQRGWAARSGVKMEPEARTAPDRRRVITAATAGVLAMALPSSAAATSGGAPQQDTAPSTPTDVTAVPLGYVSDGSTGAIRVSWSEASGATDYEVGWATGSPGSGPSTYVSAGSSTSFDLTGLTGTDTTHRIVVRAIAGTTASLDSLEVTSSSVIATGGAVTTFVGDGTTGVNGVRYVVHTFSTVGTTSLSLNRTPSSSPRSLPVVVAVPGGPAARRARAPRGPAVSAARRRSPVLPPSTQQAAEVPL